METGKRTRGRSKTISVTNAVNVNVATVPATTNSELNGENIVQKDNSDAVNSAEKEVTSFKEVEQPEEEEKSKKDAEEIVEEIVSEHENEIESVANKDSESFTNKDRESPTNKDSESFINKDSELFTNKDSESFTNKGSESVIDQDIESVNDKENESIKVKGRKRKVSEVKFDESSLDEPNSKVTKEVIESESSFENLDDSADQSEPNSDLHLPPKQTLGKGKRARIPNKRYSDIAISPPPKAGKFLFENGKDFEKFESDVSSPASQEEIVPAPAVTTLKARTSSSSPLPKKQKMSVDLTHPNYLKPFNIGWKRELVWRATTDPSSNKRNGDIYYYTPAGKKLRSMREVSENLKNKELTLEDFTFFKEPIGLDDPEKEIIRDAKFKVGSGGGAKKLLTPKPKPKIMSPKIMSPKLPTPKVSRVSLPRTAITKNKSKSVEDVPHPNTETVESKPEVKTPKSKSTSNFKVKITPKAKAEKKAKLEAKQLDAAIAEELLMTGKKPTPKKPAKWAQNSTTSSDAADNKPCRPCSIRCQGVQGIIPTLQCRVCLCLYHNECVGMVPNLNIPNYVCKNCQLEQDHTVDSSASSIAPPPLTPINALKSITTQSAVLPKLQRIPKQADVAETTKALPKATLQTVSKVVKLTDSPSAVSIENKSLLGHVTSWLPQNSKIQLDNVQRNASEATEVPRPQYVEYLGGRKFLIIPKHNVVSVSPTIAAAAVNNNMEVKESEDTNPVAGETATICDIKIEPESPSKPENSQTDAKQSEASEVDEKPDIENMETSEPVTSESPPKPMKKSKRVNNMIAIGDKKEDSKFMDNYLQNLSYGYNTLLYVFQYLKVQDLLRAGCVCTMWRDIASHSLLWRTVRMKNSQVHSFEGLANTLQKHGTVQLDLRKMLLTNCDEIWPEFSNNIGKVDTLRKIELCRCPASVVENLTETNEKLEVINAVTIRCETMSLDGLAQLGNLRELRLKSTTGLTLKTDIESLQSLVNLKHLSLTSIRDLNTMKLDVIAELNNLESLDLGECTDFPENFGENILSKLTKLEKLRLEKGQGNCYIFEMLRAVKDMKHLEQLELVNFDIKTGFDKALGSCSNIKKLLIIPTYISQSATTNHMVLGGVLRLQKSLSHFVWGVTLELLRVTELFVDQCEEPDKKDKKEKKPVGNGDSIPVLKPVPLIVDGKSDIPPAHDPPQVEILPLPNLQKLLLQSLPTTRVKILKIPFHATWRQSITDSAN